jgi:hypothetical protein
MISINSIFNLHKDRNIYYKKNSIFREKIEFN